MLINLFQKPTEQCPRCFGKGFVDNADIERLNKKLEWISGKCAYCYGKGKVSKLTISNIPPNLSYLTLDRSKIERLKLMIGNKNAKKRAEIYQNNLNDFINHICKQYFIGHFDFETIAELHFARIQKDKISTEEKKEFIEYIEKVIIQNKNNFE